MGTQWASQVVQGGPVRVIRLLRTDTRGSRAAPRQTWRHWLSSPTVSLKSLGTGIMYFGHFVPSNLEVRRTSKPIPPDFNSHKHDLILYVLLLYSADSAFAAHLSTQTSSGEKTSTFIIAAHLRCTSDDLFVSQSYDTNSKKTRLGRKRKYNLVCSVCFISQPLFVGGAFLKINFFAIIGSITVF
jgi:hypothetical protein